MDRELAVGQVWQLTSYDEQRIITSISEDEVSYSWCKSGTYMAKDVRDIRYFRDSRFLLTDLDEILKLICPKFHEIIRSYYEPKSEEVERVFEPGQVWTTIAFRPRIILEVEEDQITYDWIDDNGESMADLHGKRTVHKNDFDDYVMVTALSEIPKLVSSSLSELVKGYYGKRPDNHFGFQLATTTERLESLTKLYKAKAKELNEIRAELVTMRIRQVEVTIRDCSSKLGTPSIMIDFNQDHMTEMI